ncbi:unnamed protein product [Pedinophyceae sp. YPF-701]|nr:unnamed protein product [Pedinophyceae sp. YPF-701]
MLARDPGRVAGKQAQSVLNAVLGIARACQTSLHHALETGAAPGAAQLANMGAAARATAAAESVVFAEPGVEWDGHLVTGPGCLDMYVAGLRLAEESAERGVAEAALGAFAATCESVRAALLRAHVAAMDVRSRVHKDVGALLDAATGPRDVLPRACRVLVVAVGRGDAAAAGSCCGLLSAVVQAGAGAAGAGQVSQTLQLPLAATIAQAKVRDATHVHTWLSTARTAAARTLTSIPGAASALLCCCKPQGIPAADGSGTRQLTDAAALAALQVLLHSLRWGPNLADSLAREGACQALLDAAETRNGPCALLALAALVRGLDGLRCSGSVPGDAGVAALNAPGRQLPFGQIGTLLQMAAADETCAAAACECLAALAELATPPQHALGDCPEVQQRPDLTADARLAVMRRILSHKGAAGLAPAEGPVPCVGSCDGVACIVAALLGAGAGSDAGQVVIRSGLGNIIAETVASMSSAVAQLSPRGVVAAVQALVALAGRDGLGARLLLTAGLVESLLSLISPAHLDNVQAWPEQLGGGEQGARVLVSAVCMLLSSPLSQPQGGADQGIQALNQLLLRHGAVRVAAGALQRLPPLDGAPTLGLITRLVLLSMAFVPQLIEGGGLEPDGLARFLAAPGQAPGVLMDALLVLSQAARVAKENYDALSRARLLPHLAGCLHHAEPGVRAKACNLLGNMCRHSPFFYPALHSEGLVAALVDLCGDGDPATRKFACFAVGNAGFHSAALYGELRRAVAPLVALLSDPDPKTRANAAGALGNLVRNSDALCGEIVSVGALDALVGLVQREEQLAAEGGVVDASSPLKVALFSLGNMCAYPACKRALETDAFRDLLQRLEVSPDPTTQKYARRVVGKLKGV